MTKVAITGGRTFGEVRGVDPVDIPLRRDQLNFVEQQLWLHVSSPGVPIQVLVGDARGVDYITQRWAERIGIPVQVFYADWDRFGKGAGPIRNAQILSWHPDFLLAFPGGRGTANMVEQATARGIAIVTPTYIPSQRFMPDV